MRIKKKLIFGCMLIFMIVSLVGCKDKELQKQEAHIRKYAKENSEEITEKYIKEKYDMDVNMVDYDLESEYSLFYGYLTGVVNCTMTHNGEEFFCIYHVDDPTCISDNFQSEEIKGDLLDYLVQSCNMPAYEYCEISYNEADFYSDMYLYDEIREQYDYHGNCINAFYNGNIVEFFKELEYLKVKVEFDSETSIREFVLNEQLQSIETVSVEMINQSHETSYLSSRCFNLKETLDIRKTSNGEITEEYVKIDKKNIVEGYTIAYNGTSDISASVSVVEPDATLLMQLNEVVDFNEYEMVSPIFYGVGDAVVVGGITAEILIEDYSENGWDYYIFKYHDSPSDGTISSTLEFVELYKNSNIIILKKK